MLLDPTHKWRYAASIWEVIKYCPNSYGASEAARGCGFNRSARDIEGEVNRMRSKLFSEYGSSGSLSVDDIMSMMTSSTPKRGGSQPLEERIRQFYRDRRLHEPSATDIQQMLLDFKNEDLSVMKQLNEDFEYSQVVLEPVQITGMNVRLHSYQREVILCEHMKFVFLFILLLAISLTFLRK